MVSKELIDTEEDRSTSIDTRASRSTVDPSFGIRSRNCSTDCSKIVRSEILLL